MSKEILAQLDERIQELKTKLEAFQSQRDSLANVMVNHAINSAPASHRVCCGNKPRHYSFGNADCQTSPTGKCVYMAADQLHKECLFCQVGEADK